MESKLRYPGIRVVTNGNQRVSYCTEARIIDSGVFYPIRPSPQAGEMYRLALAEVKLNVFGRPKVALEADGEDAAQGGAAPFSVAATRTADFTCGQGVGYGLEYDGAEARRPGQMAGGSRPTGVNRDRSALA